MTDEEAAKLILPILDMSTNAITYMSLRTFLVDISELKTPESEKIVDSITLVSQLCENIDARAKLATLKE